LDEGGGLSDDLILPAAQEGEVGFVAEFLARRAGIGIDSAMDELLSGDARRLMALLRVAGASRQLGAGLLAGVGDLLGIAEAGSALGQPLALPQIAAVGELARKLRTPVSRPALAASTDHDIELWVTATPEGDEIALTLEGWTERAPAGPRLAAILGGGAETE